MLWRLLFLLPPKISSLPALMSPTLESLPWSTLWGWGREALLSSPWHFARIGLIFHLLSRSFSSFPALRAQFQARGGGGGSWLHYLGAWHVSPVIVRGPARLGGYENFRQSRLHYRVILLEDAEKTDHRLQGFLNCGCKRAASVTPGSSLEMQILRPRAGRLNQGGWARIWVLTSPPAAPSSSSSPRPLPLTSKGLHEDQLR